MRESASRAGPAHGGAAERASGASRFDCRATSEVLRRCFEVWVEVSRSLEAVPAISREFELLHSSCRAFEAERLGRLNPVGAGLPELFGRSDGGSGEPVLEQCPQAAPRKTVAFVHERAQNASLAELFCARRLGGAGRCPGQRGNGIDVRGMASLPLYC
jgi:hypothetical protein